MMPIHSLDCGSLIRPFRGCFSFNFASAPYLIRVHQSTRYRLCLFMSYLGLFTTPLNAHTHVFDHAGHSFPFRPPPSRPLQYSPSCPSISPFQLLPSPGNISRAEHLRLYSPTCESQTLDGSQMKKQLFGSGDDWRLQTRSWLLRQRTAEPDVGTRRARLCWKLHHLSQTRTPRHLDVWTGMARLGFRHSVILHDSLPVLLYCQLTPATSMFIAIFDSFSFIYVQDRFRSCRVSSCPF